MVCLFVLLQINGMKFKRINRFIGLAAALFALMACAKDPGPAGTGEITVEATVGSMTKVSDDGVHTRFAAGDKIAVYAWTGSAATIPATRVVDGVENTFNGTQWTPAEPMRWKNPTDAHFFLGIHPVPSSAIGDFTAVPYTVDQTDPAAGDLLLATHFGGGNAGVKAFDGIVPLVFSHVMARLSVNLRLRNRFTPVPSASDVHVTIVAKDGATVNYLAKTVSPTGSATTISLPVAATVASGYTLSYSGIQVPQAGVKKITVSIADDEYVYESASDIPLTGGKHTSLGFVLGVDKLELSNVTVADWGTDEVLPTVQVLPSMTANPLTFEAKTAGAEVRFKVCTAAAANPVFFRTFDGSTWMDWAEYTSNEAIVLAHAGDYVQFRSSNTSYATSADVDESSHFSLSADCYVYGNIMSLIDKDNFADIDNITLTGSYNFCNLFRDDTHLMVHPSNRLVLPVTTLAEWCYANMFYGCTNLSSAPGLPATSLATGCYHGMFEGCSNLTSAPGLPATTLAESCYSRMFANCTHLTAAPGLPATTLANSCYNSMFLGCTKLSAAPTLPAPTLTASCYASIFSGCSRLNYVRCYAADITAANCLLDWLGDAGIADGCERVVYARLDMLSVGTDDADAQWRLTVSGTDGKRWTLADRYRYVEMGDGLQWAMCNMGADNPWDYGDYFAWGETAPKSFFTWNSYKFTVSYSNPGSYIERVVVLSKYKWIPGEEDWYHCDYYELQTEDDAAQQIWGDGWRIPTKEEWQALMDLANFDWSWTSDYNGTGIAGMVVTSKVTGYEGNSIFLPAAGRYDGGSLGYAGSSGQYWSSTIFNLDPDYAHTLYFPDNGVQIDGLERCWGRSVRAVRN